MSLDHPLGAPTWFELGTKDQAAAETFLRREGLWNDNPEGDNV